LTFSHSGSPFLFARLLFGFAKIFSEGDRLQNNKGWWVEV
jgi:hypothetical protein